jgi:hypothetical protein
MPIAKWRMGMNAEWQMPNAESEIGDILSSFGTWHSAFWSRFPFGNLHSALGISPACPNNFPPFPCPHPPH